MKTILNLVDEGHQWDFHGGVYPPSRKDRTKDLPITTIDLPQSLYVPLSAHIGQPALPVAAAGQLVSQGQLLARQEGAISANILAPLNGTLAQIVEHPACHPSGMATTTLVLNNLSNADAQAFEPLTLEASDEAILQRVAASGITGLGGAGFPTAVKLAPRQDIEYLIINAAECEPYITADDALMRERAKDIIDGIKVMQKLVNPQRVIIAIEDNKPQAIDAIEQAVGDDVIIVRAIKTVYPAGGEKQLIEVLTGQQVPSGKIPAELGIVVQNIATSYAVGQAVLRGEPLLTRIVTVTGDLVSKPGNYEVPIGMQVKDVLEQCGFNGNQPHKVIIGGPMMGFALNDIHAPVVKATNCIIAASDTELPPAPPEQNCIRCGDCEQVCPAQLLPQQLQWFAKDQDYDKLRQHDLFDCIECGACAFVCPSHIPLVQYYKVAKAEIREEDREKRQAQRAKERFEQRSARLERDKLEREEKNRLAAEKRKAAMAKNNDGDAVAAALARVKAKKAGTDTADAAPTDRVAAAIARAKAKKANATTQSTDSSDVSNTDEQKSRVADAVARAKAKKAAAAAGADTPTVSNDDEKKARVADAIARAKAKKAAAASASDETASSQTSAAANEASDDATDAQAAKKARIAATVAKAKAKAQAKKDAEATSTTGIDETPAATSDEAINEAADAETAKKARIAATVAKAKAKAQAKKDAEAALTNNVDETPAATSDEAADAETAKKARIAATVAKAKAKAQAKKDAEAALTNNVDETPAATSDEVADAEAAKKARIAATVAKAKAKAQAKKDAEAALTNDVDETPAATNDDATDEVADAEAAKKARIAATVAKAKAKALERAKANAANNQSLDDNNN